MCVRALASLRLSALAAAWACVVWMAAMAQGFPVGHQQFWTHLGLPGIAVVLLSLGLVGSRGFLGFLPALLTGGGVGLLMTWPSQPLFGILVAALALAVVSMWWRTGLPRSVLPVAAGLALGIAVPFLELAGPPTTVPAEGKPPFASGATNPIWLQSSGRTLLVQPILTFYDSAPEGGWALSVAPELQDAGVQVTRRDSTTRIDAWTHLPRPVFSHLNSYSELIVSGIRRPRVSFAGLPAEDVPSLEDPALFASWDGAFVVRRAWRGEKGPFEQVDQVPMARAAPLEILLSEGQEPVLRVRWLDWTRQASVELSPTAGWGVPVNALEIWRDEQGTVQVFLSLAATSVGRGLNTVGHAAGIYRNRIEVEWTGEGDGVQNSLP